MLSSYPRFSWNVYFVVALLSLSNCRVQAAFVSNGTADIFHGTAEPAHWQVAISQRSGGIDTTPIAHSDFPTTGFATATSISLAGRTHWIANNEIGTNGGFQITLFTFRQLFDLTGFDPSTARLDFDWAADDSGQGFADRGVWKPAFSLNGGTVVHGSWPNELSYSPAAHSIFTGFVSGVNIIDFYVEGNGVTDGMLIDNVRFVASPAVSAVPEPTSSLLFGIGLVTISAANLRRRRARAK